MVELAEGGRAEVFEFGGNDPVTIVNGFARWRDWLSNTEAGRRYVKKGRARFFELVARDCAPDVIPDD